MEDKGNKYARAQERVEEIKKFYNALMSYSFTIVFLAGINYYVNQWSSPWFLWVVLGLGISAFFKATKTFGYPMLLGRDWEKRKLEQFMREEEEQQKWK